MSAVDMDEKAAIINEVFDEKPPIPLDFVDEKQPFAVDEKPEVNETEPEPEPEPEPAWVVQRDAAVSKAITERDDAELARLSALPGGFGSQSSRRRAWTELLHTEMLAGLHNASRDSSTETDTDGIRVNAPHEDEQQVLLDTRRSFVTYPRGLSSSNKAAMQEDLQSLIVAVLQRHPRLSYFQGFHDIMTVLYLTLMDNVPRERSGEKMGPANGGDRADWAQLVNAAEVVALCRTRDAMGQGLAPMMGMLRLLRRLLAVADPQLYRVSASISPVPTLPFFALSWILTLFSHDVDTLEPVQRIFDYLMARNPISAIYLAVAILIAKKPQMARLVTKLGPEAQQDPSLLHPLFARLPPLYPDTPDALDPPPGYQVPDVGLKNHEPNPYSPIALSTVFALSDKLIKKYPWDGDKIRALEVLGTGSMVRTYDKEKSGEWTLNDAEAAIDNNVILPGGDEADDEDSLVPRSRFLNPFRVGLGQFMVGYGRLGTVLTIGIVVVGIGAVLFSRPGRTADAQWARFWGLIVTQWSYKSREAVRSWSTVTTYLTRTLREVL